MARWPWQRKRSSQGGVATSTIEIPPEDGERRSFFQLGGRRYIADAPYLLPKDVKEIDRLDFQHYMLRFLLRGNYFAPIQRPLSILDVGSGTNRWGMEMARQFPQANVIGVDLTETATKGQVPDNYLYVQGNVLKLPFDQPNFDLVHQRLLILALPSADWLKAIQELVRVTRAGGWIELVESTGLVEFLPPPRSNRGIENLLRLNAWSAEACGKRSIDLTMGGKIGAILAQAGLAQVAQRRLPIPLGKQHGRVGAMMETNYFSALGALRNLILAMQVATPEAYDAAVAMAPEEIARNQCVFPYYAAAGQKV